MSNPAFSVRDEQVLLARLLGARSEAGRQQAWRDFVQRFTRLIASCARRTLHRWGAYGSEDDVDDLVGEVWIALLHDDLRKLRAFDPARGARLSTFIGMVATNLTIDRLRVCRIDATPLEELALTDRALAVGETVTGLLEAREHAALARRALARLQPSERRFCADVFVDERDPALLARELGVTKTTIYTRKVKVRDKLRRYVGDLAA